MLSNTCEQLIALFQTTRVVVLPEGEEGCSSLEGYSWNDCNSPGGFAAIENGTVLGHLTALSPLIVMHSGNLSNPIL